MSNEFIARKGLISLSDVEVQGNLEVDGEIDLNGNYAIGLQNITDLASSGPGYWFDGVDDQITIPDDSRIDNIFDGGGTVISFVNAASDGEGNFGRICDKTGSSSEGFYFTIFENDGTNSKVSFRYFFTTKEGRWSTDVVVPLGLPSTIAITYDNSDVSNSAIMYVNGKTLTVGSGLAKQTPEGTRISDDGNDLIIGNRLDGLRTFNGSQMRNLFFNLALDNTDSVDKAIINGGDVPFKYIGASQTAIYTSDFSVDADNWVGFSGTVSGNNDGITDGTTSKDDVVKGYAANGIFSHGFTIPNTLHNKAISIAFSYYISATNTQVDGWASGQSAGNIVASGGVVGTWTDVVITGVDTRTTSDIYQIYFTKGGAITFSGANVSSDDIMYIKDFSITQIGCVLDLNPSGVGHNQWLDNSGNNLHGTVSGAEAINLPGSHQEKVIYTAVTADTTYTDITPIGYLLKRIVFEETAGNTATLSMGTSDGATDVFLDEVITASSITVININKMFSSSATQTLDLNDDGTGAWNSVSVDITFIFERIV